MPFRHSLTRSHPLRLWSRSIAPLPVRQVALVPFRCKLGPRGQSFAQGLRSASTSSVVGSDSRSVATRLKNFVLGTSIALILTFGYYYVTDTRAGVHQWIVVPSLRWFYDEAEDAHEAGTRALKLLHSFGIHPRERGSPDEAGDLKVEVHEIRFLNCRPLAVPESRNPH